MSQTASVSSSVPRGGPEGIGPVGAATVPTTFYVRRGKRWLDILVSGVALVLSSPLLLLLGTLIRLTSRGPAIFRQKVVGRGVNLFVFYKFRTMYVGADDARHREAIRQYVQFQQPVAKDAEGKPVYKILDDPRVTPLGRFLRKCSLDELPQFYNVLRGDMSAVGPRPPLPYEAELYNAHQRQRLAVRPGITGLAQVTHRHRASFEEMLRYDLVYINRQSFWLDLKIMLKTVPALLRGA